MTATLPDAKSLAARLTRVAVGLLFFAICASAHAATTFTYDTLGRLT